MTRPSNVFNAHLLCENDPLIHYGRRPRDEMHEDDAGSTCCDIEFYTGMRFGTTNLVAAVIVDDIVTCVVCTADCKPFVGWL